MKPLHFQKNEACVMELPNDTPVPSADPGVIEKSSILVGLSGPDDKLNAYNWSDLKKSVYPSRF